MTFRRPSLTELISRAHADIDARLPGADSRLRRSALDVLARTHAGAIHGLYGYLDSIALAVLPETATDADLDRRAATWGITRKASASAIGDVALAGVDGAIVRRGSVLQRIDGARYATLASATIAAGVATVSVASIDGGGGTILSANGELTFVSPISGVQAIAVAIDGLTGGADEETDIALRARLLERIRTPRRGGAAADWTAWALEVPGVTRAWVYPNWMGPGTVGLTFVHDGREDIIPEPADLAAVAAHIDPLRPVCAEPIIFSPTPLPVNFLISVSPATTAVRQAIVAELDDLFAREARPGGTIFLSRLNEAASLATGEFDHRFRAPAANVVAPAGSLPVLGTVNFV